MMRLDYFNLRKIIMISNSCDSDKNYFNNVLLLRKQENLTHFFSKESE